MRSAKQEQGQGHRLEAFRMQLVCHMLLLWPVSVFALVQK